MKSKCFTALNIHILSRKEIIIKKCSFCGETENNTKIIKGLCRRHYLQTYRHGRCFKTIYDGNDFIKHNDCYGIITRDAKGNKTNTFYIDLEDYEKCKHLKWYNKNGYARTSSEEPRFFLHQLIADNFDRNYDTDHINGDTTNNRRYNLRVTSHKANIRNMHKNKVRGIKKVPSGNFQAIITVDYKGKYLGTFNTYEEAVIARKKAELKYFGEYVK